MRRYALVACLVVSACQSTPKQVLVPVPVPCTVHLPDTPEWATGALAPEAGIWEQVKALLAERLQSRAYQAELLAAARSCS